MHLSMNALRRPQIALLGGKHHLQCRAHSTQEVTTATADAPTTNWTTIYKFKYINTVVGLNRLKVYQAAFTSIGVPICMALEGVADVLPEGSSQIFAVLGITGTIALSLASLTVGRNVVGFAYVDRLNEPTLLRLAYPDFWGRRRNVILPLEAIVPQFNMKRVPLDMYLNVKCNGECETVEQKFKLVHRHGEIVRPTEFTYVFGEF